MDASDAFGVFVVGFRVEGYAFQMFATVVALETFRMEASSCGGDDASGNGKGALGTEGASTGCGGCPVGLVGCGIITLERP